MHLYQGTSAQFIADAIQARLAGQLAQRYFDEFRYVPAPSEVTSWQNSMRAMANLLQLADMRDQGISLRRCANSGLFLSRLESARTNAVDGRRRALPR